MYHQEIYQKSGKKIVKEVDDKIEQIKQSIYYYLSDEYGIEAKFDLSDFSFKDKELTLDFYPAGYKNKYFKKEDEKIFRYTIDRYSHLERKIYCESAQYTKISQPMIVYVARNEVRKLIDLLEKYEVFFCCNYQAKSSNLKYLNVKISKEDIEVRSIEGADFSAKCNYGKITEDGCYIRFKDATFNEIANKNKVLLYKIYEGIYIKVKDCPNWFFLD